MADDPLLAEPFTQRELDILLCMSEGLSNPRIAERLILSSETVKWYVKQIYGKLAAHSREQALERARAHGLLPGEGTPAGADPPALRRINPLPQDVTGRYVGRAEQLRRISQLFGAKARLIGIYGRAGSGKTALACKVLGELRAGVEREAQIAGVVCLSAVGGGISVDRLLTDLARLLDEQERAVMMAVYCDGELGLEQKVGLLIEKLAHQRAILLLDNLETLQDPDSGALIDPGLELVIAMLLEQSSALTLLITSREPLRLPRALKTWEHTFSLEDGLAPEDALLLLRKFDPAGVAGLRDATAAQLAVLAERLGCFPRALEAVAGMLLEDPLLQLDALSRDLELLEGDLCATVVEQALSRLGAQALQVMQALAIFGQPVSYEALAFLLAPYLSGAELHALLGRLIRACFVQANRATQQLALHPLDQAYCYMQIPPGAPGDQRQRPAAWTRQALHQRAADYYQGQRLPHAEWRSPQDLEPQLRELRQRLGAGDYDAATALLLSIDRDYLWEWGQKDLLRNLYRPLLDQISDPKLAHQAARRWAWLKFFEQPDQADREFEELRARARQLGYTQGEADALDDLAQTRRRNVRNLGQSNELHRQALELYRQVGDRRGEADALGGMGAALFFLDPEAAIAPLQGAIVIQRELGQFASLSFAQRNLGMAYTALGQLEQAVEVLRESAAWAQKCNSMQGLGHALVQLGDVLAALGEDEQAQACLDEALALARQIAGPHMTALLIMALSWSGRHLGLTGQLDQALLRLREAVVPAPGSLTRLQMMARFWLSVLLALKGESAEARSLLPREALPAPIRTIHAGVGVVLIKCGEQAAAHQFFQEVLEAPSFPPGTFYYHYARALALAGLALLDQDAGRLAAALEAYRHAIQETWVVWKIREHRLLIDLLIGTPGGEFLLPVQVVLQEKPIINQAARRAPA